MKRRADFLTAGELGSMVRPGVAPVNWEHLYFENVLPLTKHFSTSMEAIGALTPVALRRQVSQSVVTKKHHVGHLWSLYITLDAGVR